MIGERFNRVRRFADKLAGIFAVMRLAIVRRVSLALGWIKVNRPTEENEGEAPRFGLYVWFVPLDDALDVPQGYIATFPKTRSPFDPGWSRPDWDQFLRAHEAVVSLKVWHEPTGVAGIRERTECAFNACKRAFPTYFSDISDDKAELDLSLNLQSTVVEVSVSVYGDDVPTSQLAGLFEEGICHIQRMQRAQGYVTGHPVRPVSLQTLPPHIPMATASISPSGIRTDGGVNLYLIESNIWQYGSHTEFDPPRLMRFESFLFRDSSVYSGFLASSSEARSALIHRGDARSSLLASATACELLLDDFLKHLLWESNTRPEECIRYFVDRNRTSTVLSRTRKYLPDLIGGSWDPKVQPPLRAWQEHVAHLRNRTIHGGYAPTQTEASNAIDVTNELHLFCMRLLSERRSKYPRTALVSFGQEKLLGEGLSTPETQREFEEGDGEDWLLRFQRWRTCLDRLTERALGRVTVDASEAYSIAVIEAPGQIRWVRHHRDAGLAANAETPEGPEFAATLETLRRLVEAGPVHEMPISVASGVSAPLTLIEDWVAEHRRIPLCGVMASGEDFY